MPLIADLTSAIIVLQGYLAENLCSDERFKLTGEEDREPPFVEVVLLSDEPFPEQRVGLPYVLLSGTDRDALEWGYGAKRATIAAPCKAAGNTGAVAGDENPIPIQTKMAQRIAELMDEDYPVLRDLGLLSITAQTGRGGQTNDREPTVTTQELTIVFVFLTVEY